MLKLFSIALLFSSLISAAIKDTIGNPSMPMGCNELLQDTTPFIQFYETVAKGLMNSDKPTAKRLLKLLFLRQKLGDNTSLHKESNPVDAMLRTSICFYREQKEPLKQVLFDDAEFVKFLKSSLPELEKRVETAIYDWELEKAQKAEYERRIRLGQSSMEAFHNQIERDADNTYEKLSKNAKQKAKTLK